MHGVDIELGAVELASFSLCLALCDALKSEEIHASVKLFPKLADKTLHHGCFFEAKDRSLIKASVGVIIGNPPFESNLSTPGAERAYNRYQQQYGLLPDKQLAYLFLHEASQMLASGGVLSLIQPVGFLYNQNAGAFRKNFFKNCNVRQILDFVSIRGLFSAADPKIIVVTAISETPRADATILHAVFRRSGRVEAEQGFEIDYYDLHRVALSVAAANDSDVWRANLLGGERLFSFVQRLRKYRTLGEYAEEKKWDFGEGFIAGQKGISHPASHIVGKALLPTKALSGDGINESAITKVPRQPIKDPKSKDRFTPPMLLIKEHQDLYNAVWEQTYLTFKDEIVGFAAPKSDTRDLRAVHKWILDNNNALRAYMAGMSIRLFTRRATSIASADIMALPFPEEGSLDLSKNEEILAEDIVRFGRDFVRTGSDSPVMNQDAFSKLSAFTEIFVTQINTVYPSTPLTSLPAMRWPGVICQPFVFGSGRVDWSGVDELRDKLNLLLCEQRGTSLVVTRIARIYDQSFIFLLKPDRLRYWLRSIALRDADDVLADIRAGI